MEPLAPLPLAHSYLAEARDLACQLRDRPPVNPHETAAIVAKIALLLTAAIGGPTDPNAPKG